MACVQVLPTRLEDVQDQLRSTVSRLAEAEAEGARARAEVNRYVDQLGRAGETGWGRGRRCPLKRGSRWPV